MRRSAPAAVALVLVAAVAGLSGAGSALTLLDVDAGNETTRAWLRADEPPLSARALGGNVSLDGEELPREPTRLDVELREWRGFANVTSVSVDGEGWALLADAEAGVAIPAPVSDTTDANDTSEAPETGTSQAEETGEGANASDSAQPAPEVDEDRGVGEEEEGQPREPAPQTSSGGDEASGDEHPIQHGITWLLAGLAAGAFAIERYLAGREE